MSINNLNTYLNVRDAHLRVVSGNVYAQAMNIGGINVETAHGLQSVSDTGNVTSNTLQFSNATTGFVTTANVQIGRDLVVTGNATISTDLTVSANATVTDTLTVSEHLLASKEATFTGNLHVTTIRSDSNVVAEYTGPHDRPLRKYPEVALTADAETGSGYKGYKVTTNGNYSGRSGWEAFDSIPLGSAWATEDGTYLHTGNGDDADTAGQTAATFTAGGVDYTGHWIKLELPKAIKLQRAFINAYNSETVGSDDRRPKKGVFLGSNNDSTWDLVHAFDGDLGWSYTSNNQDGATINFSNVSTKYKYILLLVEEKQLPSSSSATRIEIFNIEYYGYEEGSGSLDTTLKTVYNVPATTGTQLEVYYDANKTGNYTLSGSDVTNISDLSPQSRDSTATNVTIDSTWNAFRFSGSGSETKIENFTISGGDYVHSISLWFNSDEDYTDITSPDTRKIFFLGADVTSGSAATDGVSALQFTAHDNSDEGYLKWYHWSNDTNYTIKLRKNEWYHVVLIYKGGTSDTQEVYVNNKFIEPLNSGNSSNPISLPTTIDLFLGRGRTASKNAFKGMIANFRLYSKALNAEQVQELYDYQKDYFLGSKSQLTLYKGHLGVGVTEPSGQLELAGDERIQEYPPGPMSDFETYIPEHGVFCAYSSPWSTNSNQPYPWKVFNKETSGSKWWFEHSHNNDYPYGASGITTGYANSSVLTALGAITNGIPGHWIQLKLPYEIKLKSYALTARSTGLGYRMPENGIIFGSNDGHIWTQIHNHIDTGDAYVSSIGPRHFNVDNTSKSTYRYFRMATTKLFSSPNNSDTPNIGEIQFYGTPGPTTLDKGSLTLGRTLDVPRVSRYDVDTETPRPEKLLVDYDTTVNSSPTDISGRGSHGSFVGDARYSVADKAFNFSGVSTGDMIVGSMPTSSGDNTLSVSFWYKRTSTTGTHCPVRIGDPSQGQSIAVDIYSTGTVYWFIYSGKNFSWTGVTDTWFPLNTWTHVVCVHTAGTDFANLNEVYINGVPQSSTATFGGNAVDLSLDAGSDTVVLGARSTGINHAIGQISNFKVYSVTLEPSEVKKLYNLGRTGRSMVISDTAVGIGKAPEAQLDVRGNIKCDVIMPRTIAFSAYASSGNDSSTTGVFPGNATLYNFGNAYDTSTYRFTAPVNGVYHFEWNAFTNQSATSTSRIFLLKNGNIEAQKGNSIERHGNGISVNIYLDAGDYITINGSSSYPLYYYGAGGHNHFSGHLVHATQ